MNVGGQWLPTNDALADDQRGSLTLSHRDLLPRRTRPTCIPCDCSIQRRALLLSTSAGSRACSNRSIAWRDFIKDLLGMR